MANVIFCEGISIPACKGDGLFYVYELCTQDGNVFYVGKGKYGRWNVHERCAKCENSDNFRVHNKIRSILANGKPVLKRIVYQTSIEDEALAEEKRRISEYGMENLTNLTTGGDGFSHSEETKQRIGNALRGKPKSEEAKRKMSLAKQGYVPWNVGVKHTAEARQKISQSLSGKYKGRTPWNKGKPGRPAWNRGLPLSEDTRKKISAKNKGVPHSEQQKQRMSESMRRSWAQRKAAQPIAA